MPISSSYLSRFLSVIVLLLILIACSPVPFKKELISFKSEAPLISEREPFKIDDLFKSVIIIKSNNKQGTGFFISANGYALTSNHVVQNDASPSIKTFDGQTLFARVIARDSILDLTLLKANIDNVAWLSIEQDISVRIGDEVVVIGAPFSLDYTLSQGIIKAERTIANVIYIKTDTTIIKGNSGSPLISLNTGKVVGIVTFGFNDYNREKLTFPLSGKEIVQFIQSNQN